MSRNRALAALTFAAILFTTGCSLVHQATLLQQARSQYFSFADAGVSEYHCDVYPDWAAFYTSVNRTPPPDDAWQRYLGQAHLTFSAPTLSRATVKWIAPQAVPAGSEDKAKTMQDSFTTMVSGFLQAWNPALSGTLLPTFPFSNITPQGNGYSLTEHDLQGRITDVTMDANLHVTHLSTKTPNLTAEIDTTFIASPRGLVLSQIDSRTHQPPTAPEEHVITRTTYQTIQDVPVPSGIFITTERSQIPMNFSNCGIQK